MRQLSGLFIIIFILSSCEKDDNGTTQNDDNVVTPLVFSSLTTDKDTVAAGETATITALVSGSNISYTWSATGGSILGSGNKVSYASCSCNAGKNVITCTVTDSYDKSDSKAVSVFVLH